METSSGSFRKIEDCPLFRKFRKELLHWLLEFSGKAKQYLRPNGKRPGFPVHTFSAGVFCGVDLLSIFRLINTYDH